MVLLTRPPGALAEGRGCQSPGGCFLRVHFITSRPGSSRTCPVSLAPPPRYTAIPHHSRRRLSSHDLASLCSVCRASRGTCIGPTVATAQNKGKGQPKGKAPEPPATDPDTMKIAKGFKVELLYSVPKDEQGSWVSMCVDPKGRLIVSDQYGALYRITPPPIGQAKGAKIEKIPAQIGAAQGLLWAFDALYVVVNAQKSGLYRVTSSKNDDTLDTVELLRAFEGGGGEHGPHAVMLHPDGKRLTVVCGNQTKLTKFDTTQVPPVWGEDHLLPRAAGRQRLHEGRARAGRRDLQRHARTARSGSCSASASATSTTPRTTEPATCSPTTPTWSGTSTRRGIGRRASASSPAAASSAGATARASTRPTTPTTCRRSSTSAPARRPASASATGRSSRRSTRTPSSSATGATASSTPSTWRPKGSAYKAELEEFVTGTPLPLTDVVINPIDGAMYFAIGGRRDQDGPVPRDVHGRGSEARTARDSSRRRTGRRGPRRRGSTWRSSTQRSGSPRSMPRGRSLTTSGSLHPVRRPRRARTSGPETVDRQGARGEGPGEGDARAARAGPRVGSVPRAHEGQEGRGDPALRGKMLEALGRIDFAKLTDPQKLDLVRVYHVLFNRFGQPTADERKAWLAKFGPAFPNGNRFVDGELLQVFVYLQDDAVAAEGDETARGRADAGGATRIRPRAADAQSRVDAGAAQGLLHVVPQGRELQGREQLRQLPEAHQD